MGVSSQLALQDLRDHPFDSRFVDPAAIALVGAGGCRQHPPDTAALQNAGSMSGSVRLDPLASVSALIQEGEADPRLIVNTLLDQAVELEQGRPRDDISIMAIAVLERDSDEVRRLSGRLPL